MDMGKMEEFIQMIAAAMNDRRVLDPIKTAVSKSISTRLDQMDTKIDDIQMREDERDQMMDEVDGET